VWGKWENVKGAADGKPTDPAERLAHRREQAARILRRQELKARGTRQLREDLQERGLESKGQKKELINRLMSALRSDASPAEGYLDELAEHIADEDSGKEAK
jgi:hypothetical protein